MRLYFAKTPTVLIRIFYKYTWRFTSQKKEIFLTFDDGPTPKITQFVLNQLRKHNAKATFFCIGKNVKNHPAIFKQIINDHHTIGNHTQNHLNGWNCKTETYLKNILTCNNLISSVIKKNNTLKLFRPPYGKITKAQAKKIINKGYKIIMWDVLSADFDTSITKEKCLQNVLKNTKNGSIIVFHDSVKASEKLQFVLPKVLKELSKKGYIFKAIK